MTSDSSELPLYLYVLEDEFMGIGPGQMILIGAVILLLFGAKKIPELMRSLGSGMTQFKRGLHEDPAEENSEGGPAGGPAGTRK